MQAFNQRLWRFCTSSRKHLTFATEKFTEGNWSWNQEASHCWRHRFLTQTLRWGCSNALRVSLTSVWRDQWINGFKDTYLFNETRSKEHLLWWEVKVWISQQSPFGLPQTLTHVPLFNFHSTITKLLLAFGAKIFCTTESQKKKTLPRSRGRKETPAKHLAAALWWTQPLELRPSKTQSPSNTTSRILAVSTLLGGL